MKDDTTYRGWTFSFDYPPVPSRQFDWSATHPDYDGEGDSRYVTGPTPEAVEDAIDAWYEENEPAEEKIDWLTLLAWSGIIAACITLWALAITKAVELLQ